MEQHGGAAKLSARGFYEILYEEADEEPEDEPEDDDDELDHLIDSEEVEDNGTEDSWGSETARRAVWSGGDSGDGDGM